ncbi:unnamed protein product [Cochlearia groenlandica]
MTPNKKLISLVMLCMFVKATLSETHGVVIGKDIYNWNIFPIIRVIVTNSVDNNLKLHIRCMGQFQAGAEIDSSNMILFLEFTERFWRRISYPCQFTFGDQTRHFTIYEDRRDNKKNYQCQNCYWSIRNTGPCALNAQTGIYDICYAWDK